MNGKNVTLVH